MCLFGLKKIFIEFKIIPSILKWEKENIGERLYDLGLGKNFVAKTPKSWSHEKKNKLGSRKIKNLCFWKILLREWKTSHGLGENSWNSHIW